MRVACLVRGFWTGGGLGFRVCARSLPRGGGKGAPNVTRPPGSQPGPPPVEALPLGASPSPTPHPMGSNHGLQGLQPLTCRIDTYGDATGQRMQPLKSMLLPMGWGVGDGEAPGAGLWGGRLLPGVFRVLLPSVRSAAAAMRSLLMNAGTKASAFVNRLNFTD